MEKGGAERGSSGSRRRPGRRGGGRGFGFGVFAEADEGGADDDEDHSSPADRRNAFTQKDESGKRGHDKAQSGEGPEEADVALGHEDKQAREKQRCEKYAQQDARIDGAGFYDADNFGGADGLISPTWVMPFLRRTTP